MGVLYDVLFKPIGRGDGSNVAATTTTTTNTNTTMAAQDATTGTTVDHGTTAPVADDPPEWVLDRRRDDDSRLVWRRTNPSRRRRVEFLDAVQVREFERDDYTPWSEHNGDDKVGGTNNNDDNDQAYWTDDWCGRDGFTDGTQRLRFYDQSDDCPVLVAVSVTVLGLCIGFAYMFAPVRWLFEQLLVDD